MEESNYTTLNGKGFRLIPFSQQYIPVLHKWESDPESLYLWTNRRDIISECEYAETMILRLKSYYHVFLIILNNQDKPVGFIYSYDSNFVDGYIFTTTFLEPSNRKFGIGVKAGILFYSYLFAYYPLRKIYADAFDYNSDSLLVLKHAGFEIEGTSREHRFFRGKYHDMYRLALYREKVNKKLNFMYHKIILSNNNHNRVVVNQDRW